jgi:hypothetical protein
MKEPFFFVALCAALCGCGHKHAATLAESNPAPTPEQTSQIEAEYILPANNAATPAPANPAQQQRRPAAQPASVMPIQERINGAIHAQLTVQLRMYIEKTGRVPDSFDGFIYSTMDSAPLAPVGMKFVIDPVDKAVKVVKKQP